MNLLRGGYIDFTGPVVSFASRLIVSETVAEMIGCILKDLKKHEALENHNYVDEINIMRIILYITRLDVNHENPKLVHHKRELLIAYVIFTQPDKTLVHDYKAVDLRELAEACKKVEQMKHMQVLPMHDTIAGYFRWRELNVGDPECDLIMMKLSYKILMAHLEMTLF